MAEFPWKGIPILKGFHQGTFLVLYWFQQNALNCLLVDAVNGLVACMQEGRNTIWPHNPQTGWSYCVMIPSWITQTPEAGVTADSFLKSVVVSTVYLVVSHCRLLISPICINACRKWLEYSQFSCIPYANWKVFQGLSLLYNKFSYMCHQTFMNQWKMEKKLFSKNCFSFKDISIYSIWTS